MIISEAVQGFYRRCKAERKQIDKLDLLTAVDFSVVVLL